MNSIRIPLIWFVFGACSTALFAAEEYQVVSLGTLGGAHSAALGLNDLGQVVGSSQDEAGRTQAFLWQNGALTGLGFLPGGTTSVANAINNQGNITGDAAVSATNGHAFLFISNSLVDIGTLGGPGSWGRAINDSGDLAGSAQLASNSPYASDPETFFWRSNQFTHVRSYHDVGSCDGFGLNNEGIVCGITFLWANDSRWWAYVWQDDNGNGVHDSGEMQVLGSLGTMFTWGAMSGANAINDLGQVVGWTGTTNVGFPRHAFLVTPSNGQWKVPSGSPSPTNTLMRSLGVLGGPTNNSYAKAINNRAWIVGSADMPSGTNQAFLWRNGVLTNLNDLIDPASGWVLTDATGINEHNEIVGTGLFQGQPRAYILRQEGRISDIVPVGWTEIQVHTNELNEVVTQEIFHVETQVLHWAGIWGTNANTGRVFTVEYCDALHPSNWAPFAPAAQWPIAQNFWTNGDFASSSTRFFRIRATEGTGGVKSPATRSGKPPRSKRPVRRATR